MPACRSFCCISYLLRRTTLVDGSLPQSSSLSVKKIRPRHAKLASAHDGDRIESFNRSQQCFFFVIFRFNHPTAFVFPKLNGGLTHDLVDGSRLQFRKDDNGFKSRLSAASAKYCPAEMPSRTTTTGRDGADIRSFLQK